MNLNEYTPLTPLESETPLVSVVMFCRNRVNFIRRAVESIVTQTYPNWELIIQDGASTDGTKEALESYSDPRIKLISEPDTGPFDAMWRAFRRCEGEIIGSCLSDEELLPHALAEGVHYFLCNPESAAIARDLAFSDVQGKMLGRYSCTEYNFLDYLSLHTTLTLQSALFRRTALIEIGFLTRAWRTDCADFELISYLGEKYRLDYYPGIVGKYCQHHEGQLSTTPEVGFFCALGQLRFIADFFAADPQKALLRDMPLQKAYGVIKALYRNKGATALEAKLDAFFATLEVKGIENNVETALQGMRIGKLDIAYRLFREHNPALPDLTDFQYLTAEVLERFCQPQQSMGLWSALADKGFPQAAERFLLDQIKIPETNSVRILANQKKWAAQQNTLGASHPFVPPSGETSRPRLAFHAADWRTPQIQHQFLPLLGHLDANQWEILCYYSAETERATFPSNVSPVLMQEEQPDSFLRQVRDDQVQIFVELSGFHRRNQIPALAARCAPVQIVYLGFTSTTGLRQIDYQIVDNTLCPPALEKLHTEKILRLPQCYTSFSAPSQPKWTEAPPPRRLDDRFTFGCFTSATLMNSTVLDCWGRLLKMAPEARLILANPDFNSSDCRIYIRSFYRTYNLPPESLLLLPRPEHEISPYLTAQIDLHLDTFPQSDPYAVACCLSRGIPSITLAGSTLAGRYGTSLLLAAGLPNCIATTIENYAALATVISRDPHDLRQLRTSLSDRLATEGFTNLPQFAADFQELLMSTLSVKG